MTILLSKQSDPYQALDVAYMNMRASLINVIDDTEKTNLAVITPISRIAVWTKNIYENLRHTASEKYNHPQNLEHYCELYQRELAVLPFFKGISIDRSMRTPHYQFIQAIQKVNAAKDLERKAQTQRLNQQKTDLIYTECLNHLQQLDVQLREKIFSKELLKTFQILRDSLQNRLNNRKNLEAVSSFLRRIRDALDNDKLTSHYLYSLADEADHNFNKRTTVFFMLFAETLFFLCYVALMSYLGYILLSYSIFLLLIEASIINPILFFGSAIGLFVYDDYITSYVERTFDRFRTGLSKSMVQVAVTLKKLELERTYQYTMNELDVFAKTSPYRDIIVKLIAALKKDQPSEAYIELVCEIRKIVEEKNTHRTLAFLSSKTVSTQVRTLMQTLEQAKLLDELHQRMTLIQSTEPRVADNLVSLITALKQLEMDGNPKIITLIYDLINLLKNHSIAAIREFESQHDSAGYRLSYASRLRSMFSPNQPLNELQKLLDSLKQSPSSKNKDQEERDSAWSKLQQI
jgi:hypothetical protein